MKNIVSTFTGQSYVYPSVSYDQQRTINLYQQASQSGSSKAPTTFCPTPGKKIFTTLPTSPIRGIFATDTRAFAVSYNTFYEISSDGTYVARGTIDTSFSGKVSMTSNGNELIIVDGTETGGYIFTYSTNVFNKITDPSFGGGVTVAYNNGYFIINNPNSQEGSYQISGIRDGNTWDALDVQSAEGLPDKLVALITVHQQTYLFGTDTIEVIYESGLANFPFSKIQNVFIQYGTNSPFSISQTANTIFWVGNDKDGTNTVWRAEGFQPIKISNKYISSLLNADNVNIAGATSYSYQEDDTYFYCLNVPGLKTTLVYDVASNLWHERGRWNTATGTFTRDSADEHMFIFGKHLVSSYENGNIFEQSTNIFYDEEKRIKRVRVFPYIDMPSGANIRYDYLWLDCEVAIAQDGDDEPTIELSWSDTSTQGFTNPMTCSLGKIGEYATRVKFNRLGRGRDRAYRLATDYPGKIYWHQVRIQAEEMPN